MEIRSIIGKILLPILLLLLSCTNQPKTRIAYKKVICPTCHGSGVVKLDVCSRVFLGIITLGPGAMETDDQCSTCGGTGYITKEIIDTTKIYYRYE